MTHLRSLVFVGALAVASIGIGGAQTPQSAKPAVKSAAETQSVAAKIRKTLEARLPNINIENIQPSSWPGLYEVVTDSELVYADASGDFLFVGNVMDTKTRNNLTEKRWNELLKVDFNTLPLDSAIRMVKGDGSRKLVVFSDPFCPYCIRFEKTLQDVDNVTVYTLLYPIESLHPGATAKSKQLWCNNDRLAAWREWMLSKKEPAAADCKGDPIAQLVAFGGKLKVNGTPTLIFADGHRVSGAIGKEQLEKEFAAAAK